MSCHDLTLHAYPRHRPPDRTAAPAGDARVGAEAPPTNCQFGWACGDDFEPVPRAGGDAGDDAVGMGVGDCACSWGIDGHRQRFWHDDGGTDLDEEMEAWESGDIIGWVRHLLPRLLPRPHRRHGGYSEAREAMRRAARVLPFAWLVETVLLVATGSRSTLRPT